VKKYAEKHPDLIFPIFQKENQYSKGKKPNPNFNYPRAKGSYIALCEGDDYWTDPYKLQNQIAAMVKYPECDMSFHAAIEINYQNFAKTIIGRHTTGTEVCCIEDVIIGGGSFCPTASLVFKKSMLKTMPKWFFNEAQVGDLYLQLYGALNGGLLYIDETMSVYRKEANGSWTQRLFRKTRKEIRESFSNEKKCYSYFNLETNGRYSRIIKKRIMLTCLTWAKEFFKKKRFDVFFELSFLGVMTSPKIFVFDFFNSTLQIVSGMFSPARRTEHRGREKSSSRISENYSCRVVGPVSCNHEFHRNNI
jgi:hypothetical protein